MVLAIWFSRAPILAHEEVPWNHFGKAVFLTPQKIDSIRFNILAGIEPQASAYLEVKKIADQGLFQSPVVPRRWHVPFYYLNKEGHKKAKRGLLEQARLAYAQAIVFHITNDSRYALSALRFINAWASELKLLSKIGDSKLSFSYHFSTMIFAADLLRSSGFWSDLEQYQFETFLLNKAKAMHTMRHRNNWSNWGLVLYLSIASYLKDKTMAIEALKKWKELIARQIDQHGVLVHEVKRSRGKRGIWYSNFTLISQTIAAEIFFSNGVDIYSYQSQNKRSLKLAFEKLIPWVLDPKTFPFWKGDINELVGINAISYWEILLKHWPNQTAGNYLFKLRPLSANHGAPFLTLTHGF